MRLPFDVLRCVGFADSWIFGFYAGLGWVWGGFGVSGVFVIVLFGVFLMHGFGGFGV